MSFLFVFVIEFIDFIFCHMSSFSNAIDLFYKSSITEIIGIGTGIGLMLTVILLGLIIFRVLEKRDLPNEQILYKVANYLYHLIRDDGQSISFGKVTLIVACLFSLIFIIVIILSTSTYTHQVGM